MFVFRRSFDLILDTLVAISRQSFLLYSTASTFAVVYLVVFLLCTCRAIDTSVLADQLYTTNPQPARRSRCECSVLADQLYTTNPQPARRSRCECPRSLGRNDVPRAKVVLRATGSRVTKLQNRRKLAEP